LGLALPQLESFAVSPPRLQGAAGTVAGFDPTQLRAQDMAIGAAGPQRDILRSAGGASTFLTSGAALDPSTNPALAGTIRAATRPIYSGLTEEALPAIRSEAVGGGANYGGSRQGIAEGLAIGKTQQAAEDAASKISFGGYQSGLDAMKAALGLAPATAGAQTIPAGTVGAVGDVRQGQTQAELAANNAAFNFDQWLPYLIGTSLAGIVPGLPGGAVQATGATQGSGTGFTSGTGESRGTAPQGPGLGSILTGAGSLAGGLLGSGGLSGGLAALRPFL